MSFVLPVYVVSEAGMAPERKRGSLDILLVEDDRDIREVVAQLLEHCECRVQTAVNGKEALGQLESGFRPDVILLNLYMPGMDGWTFRAQQLRNPGFATIPVVLVSGVEGLEAVGRSLGVAAIHQKPVVIPALLETLNAFRRNSDPGD